MNNYTELTDFLSVCGIGAVLINEENTVLSLNEKADGLLCGNGQLPGQKLPDVLLPAVAALRENMADGQASPLSPSVLSSSSLSGDQRFPVSAGGAGSPFFSCVLKPENAPRFFARIGFGRYVCCEALVRHPLLPGHAELLILRDAAGDHALAMMVTALDQVHEAVVMCDEEDRIYFCNNAAVEIDDLDFEEVCGQSLDDVYENEDATPLIIPQARRSREPSLNHRQFYHTKNGQRREVISNFFPVLHGADTLGAFSVVEDWDTASSLQRKVIDLQDRVLGYEQILAKKLPEALKSDGSGRSFQDFVQHSAVARNTAKLCREAAATDRPLLLYGEPGTGRHFLAQCIHAASNRSVRPFLHFSCASLPNALLDAMLFGISRDAYPEAEEKKGLLEQAESGTLYLSDIDVMGPVLQQKLLRVLQSGAFSRAGSSAPIPLRARFLLGISLTPDKAIEDGKLASALYSFLQHQCIMVPALRTRQADIIPLAMEFVNSSNHKYGKNVVTVSDSVLSLFKKYRWAGNVRELRQVVSHAVRSMPAESSLLTTEYLPGHMTHIKNPVLPAAAAPAPSPDTVLVSRPADNEALKDTVTQLRRQSIYQILLKNNGNITRAAEEMGLSRQNLQYHIRACSIDLAEIRAAAKKMRG